MDKTGSRPDLNQGPSFANPWTRTKREEHLQKPYLGSRRNYLRFQMAGQVEVRKAIRLNRFLFQILVMQCKTRPMPLCHEVCILFELFVNMYISKLVQIMQNAINKVYRVKYKPRGGRKGTFRQDCPGSLSQEMIFETWMMRRIQSWESSGKEPSVQRHLQRLRAYERKIFGVFEDQEDISVVKFQQWVKDSVSIFNYLPQTDLQS